MRQQIKSIGSLIATLVAVVLSTGGSVAAYGDGACRPPTPPPCAADGVCRPMGPWGYNRTRWRPWPGAESKTPTPATTPGGAGPDGEFTLPDLQRPDPREEDRRGPAKPQDDEAAADDAAADELAPPQSLQQLPLELPIAQNVVIAPPQLAQRQQFDPPPVLPVLAAPNFQRESSTPELSPSLNDLPPELPASMRQQPLSDFNNQFGSQPSAPAAVGPGASNRSVVVRPRPVVRAVPEHAITRTGGISLINPAAAVVIEDAATNVQPAAFVEATDQPPVSN